MPWKVQRELSTYECTVASAPAITVTSISCTGVDGFQNRNSRLVQAMSTSAAEGERPVLSLKSTREMAVINEGAESLQSDAAAFFEYVDALLKRSPDRELLIYVHGANTDFDRAAAQAAQFQHFMGPNAVVMVFAWPSAGTLLRYGRDVVTARRSVPVFASLLELLSRHTQAEHLNLLAYSAGSMIVSPGLARVGSEAVLQTKHCCSAASQVFRAEQAELAGGQGTGIHIRIRMPALVARIGNGVIDDAVQRDGALRRCVHRHAGAQHRC